MQFSVRQNGFYTFVWSVDDLMFKKCCNITLYIMISSGGGAYFFMIV